MRKNIKRWAAENRFYILAFLIPFVTAVAAFIGQGMWPFGDRGISIIDSYHQYVPFFQSFSINGGILTVCFTAGTAAWE